ncbi:MAG: CCA tRNA nucleotidyltransferase [Oscillospiraceae bacterium]
MKLPEYVIFIIERLEKHGYEAYVVGGAVRDELMNRKPTDYDFCTSASPTLIKEAFSDFKIISCAEQYGTVCVRIGKQIVEITTFRSDGDYSDSRHPDSVVYTRHLQEDLARRDFTLNAIAYNPKTGFIDPFLGLGDIRRRVVKTVGDPMARFSEDALRIMRGVRFCAKLGFSFDSETETAAIKLCGSLNSISAERIRDELFKFIVCKNAGTYLLKYREIFFAIIPELRACDGFDQHNPNHSFDILGHTAETINRASKNLNVRMAALLHDIGKPLCFSQSETGRGRFFGHMEIGAEMSRTILTRLHCPSKMADIICSLVLNHDKPYSSTPESARYWLSQMGRKSIFLLTDLKKADCLAHARSYHNRLFRVYGFKREILAALARGDCFSLYTLAVKGSDINAALNIKPSPVTGQILQYLLNCVIEGSVKNNKNELIPLAKDYHNTTKG